MAHHGPCWIVLILTLVLGSYATCPEGKCGRDCTLSCIGNCNFDCHKDNCSCRNCKDGMYGENCSLNCSSTCYSEGPHKLCNRLTGACEGCIKGYCSPINGCNTTCGENCTGCDVYDCKCTGCKAGHYGDFCQFKHCPETVTTSQMPIKIACRSALICMSLAILAIIAVAYSLWKHHPKKLQTNADSESSPGPQQTYLSLDESMDVCPLKGIHGTERYILSKLPNTLDLENHFLKMLCENNIEVIVFISSNGSSIIESYVTFWDSPKCTTLTPDHCKMWTLTKRLHDGSTKTATLYHYSKWFDKISFGSS